MSTFAEIPTRVNGTRILRTWFNMLRDAGVALENGIAAHTAFSVPNNQSVATTIGLTINGLAYTSAEIDFEVHRKDDGSDNMCRLKVFLMYKSGTWQLSQSMYEGDDCELTFSITTASTTGTLKLITSNMTGGGSYTGTGKYVISKIAV